MPQPDPLDQRCSHLCIKCRKGPVPFWLPTTGAWILKTKGGGDRADCEACGAKHQIMMRINDDGSATITVRYIP
jgi:hypothetical protein